MSHFHFWRTLLVLVALPWAGAPAVAAQPAGGRVILLDRIVAVVNEDVITRRDA